MLDTNETPKTDSHAPLSGVSHILGYFYKLGDKYVITEIDGNMLKGFRFNHNGLKQTMLINKNSTESYELSCG